MLVDFDRAKFVKLFRGSDRTGKGEAIATPRLKEGFQLLKPLILLHFPSILDRIKPSYLFLLPSSLFLLPSDRDRPSLFEQLPFSAFPIQSLKLPSFLPLLASFCATIKH